MQNLFQWHAPAVKKLLGWRQGGDEEKWAEKAVETLVKKLAKKKSGPGTVDDLLFALANPGSHSRCVTIPKSLDGRLQVSHKKGLPHVIFCRVWRWPDLQQQQELRPMPECMFPYDTRRDHICINPYHYQRIHVAPTDAPPFAPPPLAPPIPMSPYPSSPSSISPSMAGSSFSGSCYGSPHMDNAMSPGAGALSDDDDPMSPSQCGRMAVSPGRPDKVPEFWATIGYYELNTRVGDLFRVEQKSIRVDGFTDPSNCDHRICLGLISNVNRNATIENTRRHIGKGIQLEYTEQHDLQVSNMSEAPIFLQSRNSNFKLNKLPTTVMRIPPGHTFVAFDNSIFHHMLQGAFAQGYKDLYDLQKMCFIRISFVKGWGADYPRQDITSTPCWIELQLNQPLAWIDTYLQKTPPPNTEATSVSL